MVTADSGDQSQTNAGVPSRRFNECHAGAEQTTLFRIGQGGNTTGAQYSYGTLSSTERALGSLGGGSFCAHATFSPSRVTATAPTASVESERDSHARPSGPRLLLPCLK